jgi:hypothetical protein
MSGPLSSNRLSLQGNLFLAPTNTPLAPHQHVHTERRGWFLKGSFGEAPEIMHTSVSAQIPLIFLTISKDSS